MRSSLLRGTLFGCGAVLAWAVYNIGVAQGRAAGFAVADLTLLRYLGASLALLPFALRRSRIGIAAPSGRRILILLLMAGPHFSVLYNVGMPLTRLSHAVVISPGVSMIVAMTLASVAAGRRPDPVRLTGISLLIVALLVIAADHHSAGLVAAGAWRGDIIFVVTGTLYGAFSYLLGLWRADAVLVTFWISALSLALVGPWYLAFAIPTTHAPTAWLLQLVLQGVLGGGLAIVLYTLAIRHLGAGRAAIFLALVPVVTALLSAVVTGEPLSPLEGLASVFAAFGMFLAMRERKRAA